MVDPPEPGPPGVPGWVKGLAIAVAVVAAVLIVVALVGGGGHGPSRHMPVHDSHGGHASIVHAS